METPNHETPELTLDTQINEDNKEKEMLFCRKQSPHLLICQSWSKENPKKPKTKQKPKPNQQTKKPHKKTHVNSSYVKIYIINLSMPAVMKTPFAQKPSKILQLSWFDKRCCLSSLL